MSIKSKIQKLENLAGMHQPTSAYMTIDESGQVLGEPPEINGMSEAEARLYLDRLGIKPENVTARHFGIDFEAL